MKKKGKGKGGKGGKGGYAMARAALLASLMAAASCLPAKAEGVHPSNQEEVHSPIPGFTEPTLKMVDPMSEVEFVDVFDDNGDPIGWDIIYTNLDTPARLGSVTRHAYQTPFGEIVAIVSRKVDKPCFSDANGKRLFDLETIKELCGDTITIVKVPDGYSSIPDKETVEDMPHIGMSVTLRVREFILG